MSYSLEEIRSIPIYFIVGKGRSGTTLLSTILDSHPNVASATESRFLLMVWNKYRGMKQWNPGRAEEYFESINKDFRVKYLWEFEDDFIDVLKNLPKEATVQDLIKLTYIYRKSNFQKEKVRFIVDKNPRYTLFVHKLKRLFPEGKFIRIIRDPRDNITSHLKFTRRTSGMLSYKWLGYNKRFDKFAKEFPNDANTQRFEDLILDKEDFFKTFEEFTGIDSLAELEEKRLSFKDQFEEKFSERLREQHQASVKPLNPKKIGHHKGKLTEEQIQTIDSICFPYANQYGYQKELADKRPPISLIAKWQFKYFVQNLMNFAFYSLPFFAMVRLNHFLVEFVFKRKKAKLDKLKMKNAN